MGKLYEAIIDDIAIVNGKLVNCTVADNFNSRNDTTKEDRTIDLATFTIDGLEVETMVKFLWDALKVKAQARSWKHMTDAVFTALDGGVHSILDFIPKAERTGSKVAIVNNVLLEQQKKFFDKALSKAVDALDDEATSEELLGWATKYYDEEYKDLINAPE